ncbi:DUF2799 domain-containing protein [Thiomicrorhabdus sp.]|uniref:DUF2799 domain-containing protein n=1 Tax=Thiomicrorhabdus sp. TaxID=2039724 RepID=UPI0029C86CD0|nr:DUF2799 domain-containing protein [Thiomicrorhabdus sp.]
MKRQMAVLLIGGAFLSGCASLSEDECRVANWYEVGYSDATGGYQSGRISDHREACAPVGVKVDLNGYLSGYQQGLQVYCSRQTGFKLGKNGNAFPSQCRAVNREEVELGYVRGSEVHRLLDQRQSLLESRKEKVDQIHALDKEIAELRQKIKKSDSHYKSHLYRDLQSLEKLRSRLDEELYSLDRMMDDLSRHAQLMESDFYRGR